MLGRVENSGSNWYNCFSCCRTSSTQIEETPQERLLQGDGELLSKQEHQDGKTSRSQSSIATNQPVNNNGNSYSFFPHRFGRPLYWA